MSEKIATIFQLATPPPPPSQVTTAGLLALVLNDYAAKAWAPDDSGHKGAGIVDDNKRSETGGYNIAFDDRK